ncbi:22580_t:CDS:1 [Cetraspora pellucida]|uniref:22580_t:CDS:1 n=1 Tax=Cetraspora pellucida TaxID=1433469 RepID=A0A9N9FIN0_9GLOM|nr:22580_t:CDS:1 [Cetraspora pellucida]
MYLKTNLQAPLLISHITRHHLFFSKSQFFLGFYSTKSLPQKPQMATRPELFTQQIILSNGATYTMRTTSPKSIIKLIKDTRNHPLWNPTTQSDSLDDESGQLSKFTKKFGNEVYDLDLMLADEPLSMSFNEDVDEKNKKK